MVRDAKVKIIKDLSEKFVRAKSVVVADYCGLTAIEMSELRQKLRTESIELYVMKNTLARLASIGTPMEKAVGFLKGPTAIALSYADVTAPVRVMTAYAKNVPKLEVKGGVIENQLVNADEIKIVASLPSRDVLLSRLLSALNGPITNFAGVMAAVIRKLIYALKEIEKKKKE